MWHTQSAEVIGRGHEKRNLPCQDRTWSLERNGVTAIALADGAGSARLSHEGAECAVKATCETMCDHFERLYASASPMQMRISVLQEVLPRIRERASALGVSQNDLACTLLAVAVKEDRYLVFHVGDGVICYQKKGHLHVASAPSNGEFSNTTTFLTSKAALRDARVLRGIQTEIEGFALMSDGCEAALYQKRTGRAAPLVGCLLARAELLNRSVSEQMLQELLARVIRMRTQDDCSIALLTRRNAEFGEWGRTSLREKVAVLGIVTQNRNRRRRQIRRRKKSWENRRCPE